MDLNSSSLFIKCVLLAFRTYPLQISKNQSYLSAFNNNSTDIFNITVEPTPRLAEYTSMGNEVQPSPREILNDCLRTPAKRPYETSWEQQTFWVFLFGIMLLIAIIGNCIVTWIVLAHREMRTITNYFLLNLSVADLLMSSLNCVFNFIYMLNSDWPFGSIYCTVNNFVGNVTVASSVFTLVAISFDRYVAIVHPLQRRNSRKKARWFLVIIWILSVILSAPCLMYSTTESKQYYHGKTRTICYMQWPDGKYPTSVADYVYNIVFLVLTYGIPMLIMVVCYTIMGKELWGSQSIGEHTQRQHESVKSKKKVVRMFAMIVVIFGCCWAPYHVFYVYSHHDPQISSSRYMPHLFLGFYWLAMANSMVNPIIYYWMNRRFRHYFQKIVCFCCVRLMRKRTGTKSQTIYLHQNSSMERRSRSFRRRYDYSIKFSEQNMSSPKT